MLPLSRDQVLVVISPTHLYMLRLRGWFGKRQIVSKFSQSLNQSKPNEASWQPAIDALSTALKENIWHKANMKLVISNSLVRYTLLPWSETILNTQEELKFVRHRMNEVFGTAVKSWDVSLENNTYDSTRLACAVDSELIVKLRQLAGKSHLSIRSIQPHLVAALNFWQKQLKDKQLHFLVADSNKLSTVYIENGQLKSLRVVQANGSVSDEMVLSNIQREALMHDAVNEMAKGYLFDPVQAKMASNVGTLQKLQRLNLPSNYMQNPAAFLAAAYLA